MLRASSIRVLSLSLLALAGSLGGLGPAPAQAADKLNCDRCVDTGDVANKAMSKQKIKPNAVDKTRLRDDAVSPDKWALRVFDADNKVVGPVGPSGRVLLRASGGRHAGEWFTIVSGRGGLNGASVIYTLDDCFGEAYLNASARDIRVPYLAGVGPDPASGAVAGVPVRLVALVPNDLDAPPVSGITIESQTTVDVAGNVVCRDTSFPLFAGFLADVLDKPNLDRFTPPFRSGVK